MTTPFRVAFVPGVTITKWSRVWHERRPETPLEFEPVAETDAVGSLDVASVVFARLPIDTDGLSVIRLYSEKHVVVVSVDDPLADEEEVTLADLDGYQLHDPAGVIDDHIAIVAAGVGAVILPHAIARAHNRKDLSSVPVSDAPETEIVLAWNAEATNDDIDEFVGIVRGRSANSSRAVPTPPSDKKAAKAAANPRSASTSQASPRAGGKAKSKRKPYATSGGADAKNRSGSPNSPKARNARKRKGR